MRIIEKMLFLLCLGTIGLWLTGVYEVALFILLAAAVTTSFYVLFGFAVFNDIPFRSFFSKATYAAIPSMHLIISVVAGICMLLPGLAVLFSWLYWPVGFLLSAAGLLVCIIAVVICRVKAQGQYPLFYRRISSRAVLAGCVCVLMLIIRHKGFAMFLG